MTKPAARPVAQSGVHGFINHCIEGRCRFGDGFDGRIA
jgi:hypothetical protein